MGQYHGSLFLDVAELRLKELRGIAENERRISLALQTRPASRPWFRTVLSLVSRVQPTTHRASETQTTTLASLGMGHR